MNTQLKKEIFNQMNGNTDFQLVNNTVDKFRQYIYTPDGKYCIGGESVYNFIKELSYLLK
jgi:hypothetical protein